MKHRPELQSHTANWRRPTRSGVRRYRWSHRNSPRAPTEPNAWGDAPPHKRNAHQWRKPSAKTWCKRSDNATGSINETDTKKRLRARSGHSQRASVKPTAEADKATTKKEQGMEWVSNSDKASNWGTNTRKVTDPWRGRTKQRGKNSRRLAAAGRITASAPAAPGRQENRQAEAKASPEGEGSKPKKNNLLTGGRAEQVDLEADLRPGEHNGENQEPPKTRSFSEDHPVRGRQRLQGASRATDRGTKPQPAESRSGYPRPSARVVEATLNPNMGQWRTLEGAKDNLSSQTQRGPPGNTPWRTGRAETPQTEACGPTMNWPVYLTQTGTLNLRSDRGQTIPDPAGVTPSRR